MSPDTPILPYAPPTPPKPRRLWIPITYLFLSYAVWNWPRLTPTHFPKTLDLTMLILLLPTAFLIARDTSLPVWTLTLFGALTVALFLFAHFNDNNFRRTATTEDILLPWTGMVAAGALVSLVIAGTVRRFAT